MSDLKLYSVENSSVKELKCSPVAKEKNIQNIIESNSETLLRVRFLCSEYTYIAEDGHLARIDTLGIDEDHCPIIIEYKRDRNDTVINQGLFYMDWLVKHEKDFAWLVMEKLGKSAADKIDWSHPRLICVANDFSRYDEFAIKQLPKNIDLIRYRIYNNSHLLLELVNSSSDDDSSVENNCKKRKNLQDRKETTSENIKKVYKEVDDYLLSLDDNIQKKELKHYIAYKRINNFAAIAFQKSKLLIFVHLNPKGYKLEEGFTRDVSNVGHRGTGELEISIKNLSDFEKAKPLIKESFENS